MLTPSQRRFLNAMPNACPDCGGVTRCTCERDVRGNRWCPVCRERTILDESAATCPDCKPDALPPRPGLGRPVRRPRGEEA